MPRRKDPPRDYSRRGVYVDYLHRFAWTEDSLGRKSRHIPIFDADDEQALRADLAKMLDILDPIPSDVSLPVELTVHDLRHLRLVD